MVAITYIDIETKMASGWPVLNNCVDQMWLHEKVKKLSEAKRKDLLKKRNKVAHQTIKISLLDLLILFQEHVKI